MPASPLCLMCRREGRWLEISSAQAFVNYYRCASGHVWCVQKNDPHAVPTFVTPDPVQRRKSA